MHVDGIVYTFPLLYTGIFQNLLPGLSEPTYSQTARGVLSILAAVLDIDAYSLITALPTSPAPTATVVEVVIIMAVMYFPCIFHLLCQHIGFTDQILLQLYYIDSYFFCLFGPYYGS